MKITRIIAFCVVVAGVGAGLATGSVQAKSLRDATTPAEFPPVSYKAKQYVDSKGCIFIRAGIDGNVTWVPRVSRSREQICGYKPSLTAGQVASAPKVKPASKAPVQITLAPAAAAPGKPAPVAPAAPRVVAAPKPRPSPVAAAPVARTPRAEPKPLVYVNTPSKQGTASTTPVKPTPMPRSVARTTPQPLVFVNPPAGRTATASAPRSTTLRASTTPRTAVQPTPRAASQPLVFVNPQPGRKTTQTATRTTIPRGKAPSPGPIPPTGTFKSNKTCPNASVFSQQFINNNDRYPVRCGPQSEHPSPDRRANGRSSAVDPATRIVPRHVYEQRQNTTNVEVAAGYQPVWKDDRLNPHRAERTTAPAAIRQTAQVPSGYKNAWDDDRLNASRATASAAGDAQTDQIWTRKLPRTLIRGQVPAGKQTVTLSSRNRSQTAARISSRSAVRAPKAQTPPTGNPKYVRVATYASDASARAAAKNLAQRGLPMRLGTVTRSGKAYRVVLAGPFASTAQAKAALAKVRSAGFSKAKISK